ncbi:MAG: hypothetical protein GF333_04960 [Candidatus Omnitrophica bacterium]|nr:hypothetical protein [Candidatus Omnitrophota bacterium]
MAAVVTIQLKDVVRRQVKGRYYDLVTRQIGKSIFRHLEEKIAKAGSGTVIILDFADIGAIDYSCADEIFARLVRRLQLDEYGEKYLALKGLSPHHKENIDIVMEKNDLAVLVYEKRTWEVLGSLDNYLFQTLEAIMDAGQMSSPVLSQQLDLALNTASMRLRNLSKLRLVKKRPATNDGGKRCFIYETLTGRRN